MQFRTNRNHHFMFHLHEMISMFMMHWNYERATPFAAFRSARQQDKERIQSELGECFLYILDTWWMQDGPPTSVCTSLFPTSLAAGSGWISSWPSHWTHDGLGQLTCGPSRATELVFSKDVWGIPRQCQEVARVAMGKKNDVWTVRTHGGHWSPEFSSIFVFLWCVFVFG